MPLPGAFDCESVTRLNGDPHPAVYRHRKTKTALFKHRVLAEQQDVSGN